VSLDDVNDNDVLLKRDGALIKPVRLANGLYKFKEGTNIDRVVLDCITSLQNGADLLWIETPTPHVGQIAQMMHRVKEVVPNAKLVYNNSPSFNWTLNFRQQAYHKMVYEGKDVSNYEKSDLMNEKYDGTYLSDLADEMIRSFQMDGSQNAGIFHHLITLPTYHTTALHMSELSEGYFGDMGMLAYVKGVQRKEIRTGVACVKHQRMAGSDIGDDHKTFFSGSNALKAGGEKNTSNQFH